jgi:hypothetical protein
VRRPGGFLQAITHGYGGAALGDKALMLRPSLPENADFLKLRRFSYLGNRLLILNQLKPYHHAIYHSVVRLIVHGVAIVGSGQQCALSHTD